MEEKKRKATLQMPSVLALIIEHCLLLGNFDEAEKVQGLYAEINEKTNVLYNIAERVVPTGFEVGLTRMYIRWAEQEENAPKERKIRASFNVAEIAGKGMELRKRIGIDGYTEEMYRKEMFAFMHPQ
jgi:hypothetical protein